MKPITRFAPSPTGYLHIGGARTALFNYLFAKNKEGKYLVRIEDTDKERSTEESINVIKNGLKWLGLYPSSEPVFQSKNIDKHKELVQELLQSKKAYKCYCTAEELQQKREEAEKNNSVYKYNRECLGKEDLDKPFSVRLKINTEGSTVIKDAVMGEISVNNKELDDFIIARSDGTPTYMFAVVADDHDMEVNYIIRGDDHLTNTFRQIQLYKAFGWDIPSYAHLPLIYSEDGKKMSKRKGAVAVDEYKNMGFLPEAVLNYLLRLGWSHKDEEIISMEDAIKWFDIKDVNKSPSRFDMQKLESVNAHYIKQKENSLLLELSKPFIASVISSNNKELISNYEELILKGLDSIKNRSKTLIDIASHSSIYIFKGPYNIEEAELKEIIENNKTLLKQQIELLQSIQSFTKQELHNAIKEHAIANGYKLGKAVEGLRVLLAGAKTSPASVFEIMDIIGKEETLIRLEPISC